MIRLLGMVRQSSSLCTYETGAAMSTLYHLVLLPFIFPYVTELRAGLISLLLLHCCCCWSKNGCAYARTDPLVLLCCTMYERLHMSRMIVQHGLLLHAWRTSWTGATKLKRVKACGAKYNNGNYRGLMIINTRGRLIRPRDRRSDGSGSL